MDRFPKGQPIRLSTTIRDVTGALVNAGALTLTVVKPDGTSQLYSTPTNDGTGLYHQDIAATDLTLIGYYAYAWSSTGTGAGVAPGGFDVFDPLTAASTLYASVPELRGQFGDSQGTLEPERLEAALEAASRAVDAYCGRRFWLDPAPVARTLQPTAATWTHVIDIGSATGLVVKTDTAGTGSYATTLAATDYQLEPLDAASDGGAFAYTKLRLVNGSSWPASSYGRPPVQVTARWGWSQVPDPVRQATLLKAAYLWKRADAPFGVAGVNEWGPVRIGGREDGDVTRLLDPYRWLPVAVA
jgi:hypothetical protein